MEYFIGEITLFAFPFAPMGWTPCAGQTLQVAQNQALFSLIGYNYGGNGTTTFAVPDLRGAEPVPQMKYYIATDGIYPEKQ